MNEERPLRGLGCATAAAIFVPLPFVALFFEVGAGGMAGGGFFPLVLLFGTPIAAVHVLGLFLPAYVFAARQNEISTAAAAALGLNCGGGPALLLSGGEPVVTALFAAAGLIGGLAFWLTMNRIRN